MASSARPVRSASPAFLFPALGLAILATSLGAGGACIPTYTFGETASGDGGGRE